MMSTVWTLLFYSFFFRLWTILGHIPDGKPERIKAGLEHGIHDQMLAKGLIILSLVLFTWPMICIAAIRFKVIGFRLACLISVGWLPMLFVFVEDPNGLFWGVYFD